MLRCGNVQGSTEVFFRKVKFWDRGGRDAPPVFHADGVSYLHVKVLRAGRLLHRTGSHPAQVFPEESVLASCAFRSEHSVCRGAALGTRTSCPARALAGTA